MPSLGFTSGHAYDTALHAHVLVCAAAIGTLSCCVYAHSALAYSRIAGAAYQLLSLHAMTAFS
eukprot:7551-Heterococcus_DN1.PRE.1